MLDPKTMKYSFINTCFAHPSPAVRLRRQRHAVAQRHRPGCRLDQHQDVRRDRRCREVARLVAVRARHQRQRQARRLCRAQRTARSGQGQADRPGFGTLRGDADPGRRLDLVHRRHLRRRRRGSCASIPATGLSEVFNVPAPAFGIRGGDIDKNGVVWASSSSGHLGSFDRRKCKGPLNGPNATGNHCPEGWTFYQYPGPGFEGHRREQRRVRAITPGSTSTTRSDLARTFRCPPPISVTASWR